MTRRTPLKAAAAAATLALLAGAGIVGASMATAAELPVTFVGGTSPWKYSDNNTDPAAGNADRLVWTQGDYSDAAWKSSVGAFGAKSGSATPNLGANFPVSTVLNQYIDPAATTKVDVPTFHFRTKFDVTADQIAAISGLSGNLVYDDAVQVFVNGTKVAGFVDERVEAVPDAQKNLVYAGNGGGDPVASTFSVPASVLRAGSNTIAVALYQDRATSSDAYFDLKSLAPVPVQTSAKLDDIVLGVGGSDAQRLVTWYSSADTAQVAQFAPTSTVIGGVFPATATTATATGGVTTSGEFNRSASLSGLKENTAYSYRVGSDKNWSATYTFATKKFDGDFNFLFFGDPQIGSSGNVANDTAGWADTLNVATSAYPNAELLFSAGDQVESASSEPQYEAFLSPNQLRQIPFVATNGNHDVGSKAYEQHFATPNTDRTAGAGSTTGSGGDYWFIHKDVLFMNINSNSRDFTSHIKWMTDVVATHGAEAKWSVLAFHHSIYSPAVHATDADAVDRRNNLPTTISNLGIDVVLQGHDHAYARSYLIRNGEKADAAEVAGADSVVQGPGGVLYVTANSSSGSKYYALQNKPEFWWLSVQNQEQVRNYTAVEVTDDTFNITTLRSQTNGSAMPVNSVVDSVTLNKAADTDSQQLQVTVPEADAGEFGWSIDGTNALVDLGTAVDAGDHYAAIGTINPIRVTDTRAAGPEWSVSAQVSDFTSGDKSFSGKYLGWTPTVIEAGGGALAGAKVASGFESGNGLSVSSTLGSAAAGHARGSAKLGAGLDLQIPVEVTDGSYKAIVTLTALS